MRKHRHHSWASALLVLDFLLHALATPVFVPQFLSGGTGRNIRHLPCVSRRTGETGTCMFAFTCAKANGTHLGTCIDRFYFGSCCKLDHHVEPEVALPQDNSIDVDGSSKPSDSNDIPGNVDKRPQVKLTTKSASRPTTAATTTTTTTTTTTSKPPKIITKRPVLETTTESIRLSTFQTVSNALEQRPTTSSLITSSSKRKQQPTASTTTRPRPASSNSATSPLSSSKPTTVAYGQYLTSKKPVTAAATTTTRKPLPPSSSSSFASTAGSSRPSFGSTATTFHRNVTSPNVFKTPSSKPTSPATPRTPTVTRFPPRNATTSSFATESVEATTIRDFEETLKPVSTRKPSTTKKPVRTTTKKPSTKPRPSSTLITKKPTTAASSTTSASSLKTTTPASSSTTKTSSTSTTTRKTTTSWPTKRPLTTAPSKKPTGTTTTTSIKVSSKKPVASSTSPVLKKNATTSSTKPTIATTPTKLTSPTKRPTTTLKPTTASLLTVPAAAVTQSVATLAASTTKFTTKPVTRLTTTTTSAPPSSTTVTQKNITNIQAATTVSNELDTEFEDTSQGLTLTSGIVTWSSFSDEAESTTKPSEYPSTVPDTITEQDWNPVTTPDGWIYLPSATSEKPTLEIEENTRPIATTEAPIVQAKPVTQSTLSTRQTTTASPSPSSASPTPTIPKTTSTTTTTTTTSTTTTTTAGTPIAWPTSTQSTTYMDALSTLATVTVSPEYTESAFAALNMSNFKDVCGRRLFPESRIVGGDPSNFGRWPWQISLRQWRTSTYLHKCGAALLNENWAITAAHCVQNVVPSDLLLRIGEHDLGHEEEPYGFQERRIQIVASHPNFDPRTFEYDLALMRFYEPVLPFQPNILPICVPDDDEDYVGQQAFVTGWGRLYEDGPLPSVLQEVAVPVINNSVCEGMYRNAGYIEHIPHIFICAGWRKGGFDSCEGDSGGPLVIQRKRDRRWVLAGVISWGIGCAEPNQPGVYTRISEFREWINQILQF